MEMGSIAKWNLKEGDRFDAGTAICEVETDKVRIGHLKIVFIFLFFYLLSCLNYTL